MREEDDEVVGLDFEVAAFLGEGLGLSERESDLRLLFRPVPWLDLMWIAEAVTLEKAVADTFVASRRD